MKAPSLLFVAVVSTGVASPLICGVDPARMQAVLIPIVADSGRPGAYGTYWRTELSLINNAPVDVLAFTLDPVLCRLPECAPPLVSSGAARTIPLDAATSLPARMLYIERAWADQIHFQLRVQDMSRQSETWGTSVPVVREDEWLTDEFSFTRVPVRDDFRVALRLYAPRRQHAEVLVTIESELGGTDLPLAELPVRLRYFDDPGTEDFPQVPAYAEILNLDSLFEPREGDRLRVTIRPLTPDLRYWATISVTHNATQHVTVLSPE